jgi:hypothetical protein
MAALKALAIIMALMILGGLTLLGALIIGRLARHPPPPAAAFSAPAIGLPAGARVAGMHLGADRLVLDIALSDGNSELLVIDLKTGRRLGTIPLNTAR